MSKTDLLEDTDKSKLREDCEPAVTSVVSDSVNLWTAAYQIPLSMAFSRQEYWSGLPGSPLGHLPEPGMEPASLVSCIGRLNFYD